MNKKQLLDKLSNWSDNDQLEMSIRKNIAEESIWFEISGVEEPEEKINDHCLIFSGRITME